MATEKICQQTNYRLSCDICESFDIVETREGFVCRDCGVVLEIQKLEYHRPYNDDIVQYARLSGPTQIGTPRERFKHSNSIRLNKMNKLQSIENNEKSVLKKARSEISGILNGLDLPESYKEFVFNTFKKIRVALKPGTKYRGYKKLAPIAVYYTFKSQNIPINEANLLEISKISEKDFDAFKLQIRRFLPEYDKRNIKECVLRKVYAIKESFNLSMEFYYLSKKILYKFWEIIKNTKDDVIAGVISSIAILCSHEKNDVKISSICKVLNIQMSTIQVNVKKRIFDKFKIPGFISLIKSSDLLKKIIAKIGLIESEPEIIKIELGNAVEVYDHFNNIDFYFYALRSQDGHYNLISLNIYDYSISGYEAQYTKLIKDHLLKTVSLEAPHLLIGKGPPN
ncbi:MAG: hypothetical protein EU548_10545 [Promethearchaeota archaeon]|nr:MAG: hypothetical protein EU548_10545 [Candidatus Lokiarchaeota archaeon]